jgi:hypothetical protein
MVRQLPGHFRVGDMVHRNRPAAPGDAHDLHRLVQHHDEAARLEPPQSLGNVGRGEVVEDEGGVGGGIREAGLDVPLGSGRDMVAVDEEQAPGPRPPGAERLDPGRAGGRMEPDAGGEAGAVEHRLDPGPRVRIGQSGIDDVEAHSAEAEMAGRPAAPAADLERLAAGKAPGDVVEQHRLVAVDEAHQRVALVDIPGVRHFAAQVRPGVSRRVAADHVREAAIRANDLEARRDIVAVGKLVRRNDELRRVRHALPSLPVSYPGAGGLSRPFPGPD